MSAKDANEVIRWQLKYVSEHASELSDRDLEWAVKMEDAFKRQGYLSKAQAETLENIYGKI